MSKQSLPNLIIPGVYKSGTTSLFEYLSLHPEICGASEKEPSYFNRLRPGKKQQPPIEKYLQYFKHCGTQKYLMEASPVYFRNGAVVAQAIKKYLGDVKIIVILREPVERLISDYKYWKSLLAIDQQLDFEEYIEEYISGKNPEGWISRRIEQGFYADFLEDWFHPFEDDIKIVFFDQLRSDPLQLLREISAWLSIDDTFYNGVKLDIKNPTVTPNNNRLHEIALLVAGRMYKLRRKYPIVTRLNKIKSFVKKIYYSANTKKSKLEISEETIAYLKSIYLPYNQRLKAQLSLRGYSNLPDWISE